LPAGQKITDPATAAATGRAFAALDRAIPDVRIADYATTHNPAFVTRDGRSTFALVYTAPVTGFGGQQPRPGDSTAPSRRRLRLAGTSGSPACSLLQHGQPSSSKGPGSWPRGNDRVRRRVVIPGAGVRQLPGPCCRLLIGGISVLATFLVVGGLTEVTGVSQIVAFLIALIGLGVAIDYSLLVVSRWREERAAGRDNVAAVTEATEPRGPGRSVSPGLTVAIGLLSMIVLPVAHAAQRRLRRHAGAADCRWRSPSPCSR